MIIDDFGRQTMPVETLLNRWIVPLEKRFDFLNIPSGKKIQVPFDQLIIFSTNLEPRDLVDGAFLRRIPYKIEVPDPTEEDFRSLCKLMAPTLGFEYDNDPIDYLIEKHYKQAGRPFRACHPRDLMLQVRNYLHVQANGQEALDRGVRRRHRKLLLGDVAGDGNFDDPFRYAEESPALRIAVAAFGRDSFFRPGERNRVVRNRIRFASSAISAAAARLPPSS